MTKTIRTTISEPHLIEVEQYRLMARQPVASIEQLARFLTKLRAHAVSQAASEPEVRAGIMRYAANTALMLAAVRARNPDEFEYKAAAIHGLQFLDADLDTARAIQLLMRAEAKRSGVPVDSKAVHIPDPVKLNS
jgi:hypothetical protein